MTSGRPTTREQAATRPGPDVTDRLPDGSTDDLRLGDVLRLRRTLDGVLQVVGQVDGGLLHTPMVPPVAAGVPSQKLGHGSAAHMVGRVR